MGPRFKSRLLKEKEMTLFDDFLRSNLGLGFERLYNQLANSALLESSTNYPPYDIEKLDENRIAVNIAVAGFSRDDLNIEQKNNVLTVSGSKSDEARTFLYKGIAGRQFKRSFYMADTLNVTGADLNNGVLRIEFENVLPEHLKPRVIPIGKPDLLLEEKK